MRSCWKGKYFFNKSCPGIKDYRKIYLSSSMIGQKIELYDGRKKVSLHLKESMVSNKIALFSVTKRLSGSIHVKSKGSKRK